MHGVEVPRPDLRKRLASASLALAIDLFDNMCCLALHDGLSGVHVLARSVIESYLRGIWLTHVADTGTVERYASRRYSITLKPLLRALRNTGDGPADGFGISENHAAILDSLTHGDMRSMRLRGINEYDMGSHHGLNSAIALIVFGAQISVLSAGAFVRDVLDEKTRSEKVYEEGQQLVALLVGAPPSTAK